MQENKPPINPDNLNKLAKIILTFSFIAITGLAIAVIYFDHSQAVTIFNITLPVFSSWVGIVLAFYFGKQTQDSANTQVRELMKELTPEERANNTVTSIMRPRAAITCFRLDKDQNESDVGITELRDVFKNKGITRLPILNANNYPLYIIHSSSLDRYIAGGGSKDAQLSVFLEAQKVEGCEFGLKKGFVVVAESAKVASAKDALEQCTSCQDIFVTKGGTSDEPLLGWISNTRLAKFLQS